MRTNVHSEQIKALQTILQTFVGINIEDLSDAEMSVIRTAAAALDCELYINNHNEVATPLQPNVTRWNGYKNHS